MEYNYYVTLLDEVERKLYYEIRKGLFERVDYLTLNADTTSVHKAINAIMLDNPDIFWFQGKWKAKQKDDMLMVAPIYTFDHRQVDLLTRQISDELDKIVFNLPKDPISTIRKVYDWLLCNVSYGTSDNDQSVKGALIDRRAVCKGIARAFQLCMNRVGIPSLLVEGTLDGESRHAWNIVIADGKPYHVDVTLGYQQFSHLFSKQGRNVRYPCLMVSDKTIQESHQFFNRISIACNEDKDVGSIIMSSTEIPQQLSRYGNVSYLDTGSTCNVFLINGEHDRFALKVIEANDDSKRFERAQSELEVLSKLSNTGAVITVIDSYVDVDGKQVNILMPYLDSLPNYRKKGSLDNVDDVVNMGIDLLDALMRLKNEGYIHLDIQPKNIYFNMAGKAILGDLGGCVSLDEIRKMPKRYGTISFMAPEVYHDGIYSEASVIYSLGIILYSLLNDAVLPFEKEYAHDAALKNRLNGIPIPTPNVDNPMLEMCISRMCEFDVNLRYNTYKDVLIDLKQCVN